MAIINGSVTSGSFAQYYSFYIEYFVAQNIDSNTSTVTANTYMRKDKATQTAYGNNKSASQWLDDQGRNTTFSYDFRSSALKLVQSETYTVYHNADGTKRISLSANANFGTSLLGAASAGATVDLPTIPRASTCAVSDFNAGVYTDVTVYPASSAFRHWVTLSIGTYKKSEELPAGTTTKRIEIPIEWLNAMPNSVSTPVTVLLETFNGNTKVGEYYTTARMLAISWVIPAVSGVVTPVNTLGGYYVQGKSSVKVNLTGQGIYSSTITGYVGQAEGVTYPREEYTHLLQGTGNIPITAVVTDSRGRTGAWSTSIPVQPYSAPQIENLVVTRCNSSGVADEQGEYIKVSVKAKTTEVGSPNANSHEFYFTYQKSGDTSPTRVNLPSTASSVDTTSAPINVGQEETIKVYVYAKDAYSTVNQYVEVPTVFVLMDFGADGRSMAFGKSSEIEGSLEINMDVYFFGKAKGMLPIGFVYTSIDDTNPSEHFSGTWERFGKGKMLVGVDEDDTDFNEAQKNGGSKYVNESIRIAPNNFSLSGSQYMSGAFGGRLLVTNDGVSNPGTGLQTFQGANEAQAKQLPPYIAVYMWVRTA